MDRAGLEDDPNITRHDWLEPVRGDPDWTDNAIKGRHHKPRRLDDLVWAPFARGFSLGFGVMVGACAGTVISAVLVFLLLMAFGGGH